MKANAVHIWTARPARVSPLQWAEFESLLDDAEAAQADRFRFGEDRRAYVLAHALRRQALSHELGIAPHDLHFQPDESGKPVMWSPVQAGLFFSHSRTRRAVAIAATRVGPIGIDIEVLADGQGQGELLEPFVESSCISCFHAQWTALEAYWKAQGTGLDGCNPRIRLEEAQGGCIAISEASRSQRDRSRAVVHPLALQPDCAAALALLQPGAQTLQHMEIFRISDTSEERR